SGRYLADGPYEPRPIIGKQSQPAGDAHDQYFGYGSWQTGSGGAAGQPDDGKGIVVQAVGTGTTGLRRQSQRWSPGLRAHVRYVFGVAVATVPGAGCGKSCEGRR